MMKIQTIGKVCSPIRNKLFRSSSTACLNKLRIPNKGDELADMRASVFSSATTARGTLDERDTKLKPSLFEKKILKNKDFYNLSDGFKKIFA
jgi:hypothetical protein